MPAIGFRSADIGMAVCAALLGAVLPVSAQGQPTYPEEGTVISATVEHGHIYTIETADKILKGLCVSLNPFRQAPPVCDAGGRPMAVNDRVHFRRDGDMAYMPGNASAEQRLVILSTELKILPALPDTAAMAPESGAVLGLGLEARTSRYSVSSAPSPNVPNTTPASASPRMPAGPVTAIPVTGGPPLQVIPTGPVNNGPVTGVPVTGGPPVTAVPVTPVAASQAGSTSGSGVSNSPITAASAVEGSHWIHFVRVQTAAHVYDLACSSKSCSLEHSPLQLGDLLTIRIEKKSAYLSRAGASEQKFEILAVRSVDDAPGVPPH